MKSKMRTPLRPTSFLKKTFDFLSLDEYREIVCWCDEGKSFIIKNPGEFTNQILPIYFKHKNLASFIRQLNMYDFHKIRDSGEQLVFSHPCFIRDKRSLLTQIHRKTSENYPLGISRSKKAVEPLNLQFQALEAKQIEMLRIIGSLEAKYRETCEMNQRLMAELLGALEREKRLARIFYTNTVYSSFFNMI